MCGPHRAHNFEGPQNFYIGIVFLKKCQGSAALGRSALELGRVEAVERWCLDRSMEKGSLDVLRKRKLLGLKTKDRSSNRSGSPRSETATAVPSAAQHETRLSRRLSPSPHQSDQNRAAVVAFIAASSNFLGSILQSTAVLSPLLQETRSPHRTYP